VFEFLRRGGILPTGDVRSLFVFRYIARSRLASRTPFRPDGLTETASMGVTLCVSKTPEPLWLRGSESPRSDISCSGLNPPPYLGSRTNSSVPPWFSNESEKLVRRARDVSETIP